MDRLQPLVLVFALTTALLAPRGWADPVPDIATYGRWAQETLRERYADQFSLPELRLSGLRLHSAPHRKRGGCRKGQGDCRCPFDQPALPYLAWEGYRIHPNLFPYFPQHLLIFTAEHVKQSIAETKPHVLRDLMTLKSKLPSHTLFFNHYAGNSQEHFHWHLTPQEFPIEQRIHSRLLTLTPMTGPPGGDTSVHGFSDRCQRGLLFTGSPAAVATSLFSTVSSLVAQGYVYNLVALKKPLFDPQNAVSVALFVRAGQPERLRLHDPAVPFEIHLGASELAGLVKVPTRTIQLEPLSPTIDRVFTRACAIGVITPAPLADGEEAFPWPLDVPR